MTEPIVCPTCESDEHLAGTPHGKLIRLTCSECNLTWDRDPSPRCAACGTADVRAVPQAVWEKARGSQLSIVSIRVIYLCPDCDAERLRRYIESGTPLPPDENPAEGVH
jgi:ssDNA-binding Zn-finger/Zn-ribbon topoisomerase 1